MNDTPAVLTEAAIDGLLVDTEPYLSCDECFERIDQYVEHRVADPLRADREMNTHLAGCGVCAEEARTLEDLLRQDEVTSAADTREGLE
jgi:hypothetical protein